MEHFFSSIFDMLFWYLNLHRNTWGNTRVKSHGWQCNMQIIKKERKIYTNTHKRALCFIVSRLNARPASTSHGDFSTAHDCLERQIFAFPFALAFRRCANGRFLSRVACSPNFILTGASNRSMRRVRNCTRIWNSLSSRRNNHFSAKDP